MSTATLPNIDPKLFDKSLWSDRVVLDGGCGAASIFSQGFTTVPFSYVLDPTFSETAFRLYSFLLGLLSRGNSIMPSEEEQREILGMSEKKYRDACKLLEERGLIYFDQSGMRVRVGDAA